LRDANLAARQVTVQLRSPDFRNRFRQHPLARPSQRESVLYEAARAVLHANWQEGEALRLLGLSATRLQPVGNQVVQLGLLDGNRPEREHRMNAALDELKDWWGREAISRAPVMVRKSLRSIAIPQELSAD
jgi:DNA polymerase-4